MKEHFTEEIIEIGGKEYTLFLNRKGMVNWENKTQFVRKMQETTQNTNEILDKLDIEITDETNPFEMYDDFKEEDELSQKEVDEITEMYALLYWVMFYTHHKFTVKQAREIFDQAVEEYGINQIVELGNMMMENANKDISPKKQLKNLLAQKPMK